MRFLVLLIIVLGTASCTSMKVVQVDPSTGYFPAKKAAAVVKQAPLDIDSRKALIVVGNSEFLTGQLRNIEYFDEIITVEELETRIVREGLSEKVPSIRDRIGINNAAKHYKPFLWLRYDVRGSGPQQHGQFILTDPLTLEDYFVTETHLDFIWAGVNDQNNWYPMFNSLIDYIKANSKTYRRE